MKLELKFLDARDSETRKIIEAKVVGNGGHMEVTTSFPKSDPIEGALAMFVECLDEAIQAQIEANEKFLADADVV
jgi:hypothetical protein